MEEMMNAIVFSGVGETTYTKVPKPKIQGPNDVLMKIEAASICGTDVHILSTPPSYPANQGIVQGHEFVGRVEEVGSAVTTIKPGDRVVLDPNVFCGECYQCKKGNFNMCENVYVLGITDNGGFGEYAVAPCKMCVKISQELPAETAIFAEPLTCVVSAVNKIRLLPGESVLVLGAGPIGLYFTMLLKANGAGKIIVSEPNPKRGEYALKAGADRVINPQEVNLVEEILKETDGHGIDVGAEAVGTLIQEAVDCVRPNGRIVLFGMDSSKKPEVDQFKIVRNEIEIYGSFIGLNTLPATVELMESGLIDLQQLITHRLALKDFDIGLKAMRDGSALEVILYPDWDEKK